MSQYHTHVKNFIFILFLVPFTYSYQGQQSTKNIPFFIPNSIYVPYYYLYFLFKVPVIFPIFRVHILFILISNSVLFNISIFYFCSSMT